MLASLITTAQAGYAPAPATPDDGTALITALIVAPLIVLAWAITAAVNAWRNRHKGPEQ